ncbi:MAG: hypothetical protein JEY79_13165 [Pseudodesulfovibrio sp.]|jgi:hypothetical protein|nr:hypothetical protein [Pseudodesulfovibrio sp.]
MKALKSFFAVVFLFAIFAVTAAHADNGVEIEVINKTGDELSVQLEIHVYGEKKIINRSVAQDATIKFYRTETAHDEGALLPYWDIVFNGNCVYKIMSEDGNLCGVQTGASSCAHVEELGTCSYRFTVAE